MGQPSVFADLEIETVAGLTERATWAGSRKQSTILGANLDR